MLLDIEKVHTKIVNINAKTAITDTKHFKKMCGLVSFLFLGMSS